MKLALMETLTVFGTAFLTVVSIDYDAYRIWMRR